MRLDWLAWSNPVAVWWGFLLIVSAANIGLWLVLHRHFRNRAADRQWGAFRVELMVLLCAAYVFGCAFRSVLPRADVQRICLFDTWLSSVLVGRSVATVAEICFVIQWAIVLRHLASLARSDMARSISNAIVPLIVLAECCSWYAVITTSYLGNTVENSLWTLTFLLIAGALLRLLVEFRGVIQLAIGTAVVGIAGYLAFLVIIDVPMYFDRWQADLTSGKHLLGLASGLYDVSTRWAVTHDLALWKDEIAWMSLYFSTAVWSSLALCSFSLVKDRLPRYRRSAANPAGRRLPVGLRPARAFQSTK
ncbi:MAG TPA: hypothetical protein VH397_21130 [Xanthobacteraceae bacterium]|jgi:hypothetical protein